MRAARIVIVVLFGLLLGPAPHTHAADKLDKKTVKSIQELAKRWFDARPKTYFQKWDHATRKKLLAEARAIGTVPEGSLEAIVELLWKPLKKKWPKVKQKIVTPYGEATWIQSGGGGKKNGLILGMHGGGEGAGSASEAAGKWKLPKTMQMYPQGIRLIHDTWNSTHGERFLLTLIEIAKVQYGIDPDRVYAMGFSMGGTGSWFMAGRHPDLLAGAIPAHGVLMAQGGTKVKEVEKVGVMAPGFVPNARNLAVYFYTGREDVNCEPGTFLKGWEMIKGYREEDPEGWKDIRFQCHENLAHAFPPGEPGKGYKYIRDFKRDTFPEVLVWEYCDPSWPPLDAEDRKLDMARLKKFWFYWLHTDYPTDYMTLRVKRSNNGEENVIEFEEVVRTQAEDYTIYLNPEMIDEHLETVVIADGKEIWRGRPEPDFATILESFDARLDRRMVFDRKIVLGDEDE